MNRSDLVLHFFLDEGVPDSVARMLRYLGHKADLLRESGIQKGSPDQLVCAYAQIIDAILIALDGDMKKIARGHGASAGRYKRLRVRTHYFGVFDGVKPSSGLGETCRAMLSHRSRGSTTP